MITRTEIGGIALAIFFAVGSSASTAAESSSCGIVVLRADGKIQCDDGAAGEKPALEPRARPPAPTSSSPARPRIAQPSVPPQEVPLPPNQPLHLPPVSWAGVKQPSMPSNVHTGSSSPDAVFSSVEKSVYLLISAPSEHSLRTKSNLSQGSAVAVSPRIALTNCHVLEGNNLHFLLKKRRVFAATIAVSDRNSDRCAVAVESDSLVPIAGVRPYSTLAVGEKVYTVGSPRGLENTLGEGILSGLRRRAGIDLIQTTAPISYGSSGGGLFDATGNLIGITTFLLRGTQNLNFAIAADTFWKLGLSE
jgi:S1-C subfamily serine protease